MRLIQMSPQLVLRNRKPDRIVANIRSEPRFDAGFTACLIAVLALEDLTLRSEPNVIDQPISLDVSDQLREISGSETRPLVAGGMDQAHYRNFSCCGNQLNAIYTDVWPNARSK